jgi:hypothetical protein
VPSSEEVVHVPWHLQPALLAVRAIAHAYATFVAARVGIIIAHGDHVSSIKTGTTHRRAIACRTQSATPLSLLPYHHRARAIGEGRVGHLADSILGLRDCNLGQVLRFTNPIAPLDTLHFNIANGE